MREIVQSFVESLGMDFVSDETTEQGYRARIEREGQTAAVVVPTAMIEAHVAGQLSEIHKAWQAEVSAHTEKQDALREAIAKAIARKGFKHIKGHAERLGDLSVRFKAGGEKREVVFKKDTIRQMALPGLLASVEDMINRA